MVPRHLSQPSTNMDDRLFCVDVAVENLTILRNTTVPNQTKSFSSTSLLAQFLTFTPLHLADDLPGTVLTETLNDRRVVRLQTGKSALLRSERRNLIEHLKIGNLILAIVGNTGTDSPVLLLNAQLSLSTAAAYFLENGNGLEDNGSPLKFTSAGVVDLKDEFGRKRAELQIGYRLWQLGASMDDFISQHEHLDQRSAPTAWLPTFTNIDTNEPSVTGKINVTIDTQTDIQTAESLKDQVIGRQSPSVSLSGNSGKSSKGSSPSGSSSARKSTSISSASSSSKRSAKDKSDHQQSAPESVRPGTAPTILPREPPARANRETAVRRLIAELERLTRSDNGAQNGRNIDKQIRAISGPNPAKNRYAIERQIAAEQTAIRNQNALRAYENPILTGTGNKSFNLYSKLYLAKSNGFGVTKSYLQRLAYLPLYQGPITVPIPRPTQITKKIYMKDEATICDLSETAKSKATTSETQTDTSPVPQRRPRSASARPRSHSNTGLTANDIRMLIQAMNENSKQKTPKPQTPPETTDRQRQKRLLSVGQRSASSLGQRRQSLVRPPPPQVRSRRASRISIRSGPHTGSRSQSLSSIKSEPPSRGPSPFTESVATAIEAKSEESDASSEKYSSIPEQFYSSDRTSEASSSSVATAVEQPVDSRRPSHATIASVDEAIPRSRVSSYTNSVKFGPISTRGGLSRGGTPESVLKKTHFGGPKGDEAVPLSPVSEYLQEFKLREVARQHQLAQRQMSVRTESVSSYMPSDVEHLAYSSTSSPLQRSGTKVTRP